MQVSQDKVVSFHYSLSETGGEVLENSRDHEPTLYLHGHNNLLAALEAGLEGKALGDKFTLSLAAADAYGLRKEGAIQRIPIKHLMDYSKIKNKIKPGMQVSVNTANGPWQAIVLKVGKFNVDIDSNHPLAGRDLDFDLEIMDIRDASAEELAHGHAHGAGGHHHD
jgi:FKBP-type peptidyl-prolyl cis-trans isomerase SlyD